MPSNYDARWESALEVVQEIRPPSLPSDARVITVVVTYPPGSAGAPPHRHPGGPAFGFVLDGDMRFEVEGRPPRVVRAGETFWAPGGDVVQYSDANARNDRACRFLMTMVCAPGLPMLSLVDETEQQARRHLRSMHATNHED